MAGKRNHKGVLTIEASISYSIFLMLIVTILYIMRIVYVYGLVQHAVGQTAKELSMYSYLYQVAGINDIKNQIDDATGSRTETFNQDMDDVIKFYEEFSSGDLTAEYSGTTNPKELLKNIGAAMLGEAGNEVNQLMFEAVARPLMESYIGADSQGNNADARLKALRVVGGLSGLNLSSSSFFEDGATIDLIVCYTIDPLLPIDILPELNLASRAYVRGVAGSSIFGGDSSNANGGNDNEKQKSVWDQSPTKRGKMIQEQEHVRNLPDQFPAFSAYDSGSGRATAEYSIDIRDTSYQNVAGIKGAIGKKCSKIDNYKDTTYSGVTLKNADIKSRELIIYIPSSAEGRTVDRTKYNQAVKEMQAQYPNIKIITKEIG